MSSNPQQGKKKVGLNSVISWGATVVIVGLMFKILHYPGAELMISIGLGTEAFLFAILGIAAMSADDEQPTVVMAPGGGGKLNDLLATSITPNVIENLKAGFDQFTKTVSSVNQVANSVNLTQNFLKELETSTSDVKKFRDNLATVTNGFDQFNKSLMAISQMSAVSQTMMKDLEVAGQGMKSFAKNMNDMNSSFAQFSQTLVAINQMTASSASMLKEFEAATNGMKAYNKNLDALSRVYQAQLEAFKR